MPISKKWQNYIKFLISRTGSRVDKLSAVVGFDIREGISELKAKNAQYITTMLKQEKIWLEENGLAKNSSMLFTLPEASEVSFQIETSYNTTMVAETEKDLLNWASKRFKRDLPSLKKIKAFAVDKRSAIVDVPGYRIKRSN